MAFGTKKYVKSTPEGQSLWGTFVKINLYFGLFRCCFDDDYYDFGHDICVAATEHDVKMLNALEVVNASNYVLFQDGTFNKEDVKEALVARKSDKAREHEESIYTPIDKSFSLSWVDLDEDKLLYDINRLALLKPVENKALKLLKKQN